MGRRKIVRAVIAARSEIGGVGDDCEMESAFEGGRGIYYSSIEDNSPGVPFKPQECNPTIEYGNGIPTIYITPMAYNDMFIIVDEAKDEISWLGSMEPLGNDFLIKEVFVPAQECGAATTEMSEDGLAKLANEILKRPKGMELWNTIRFWGHSHVRMDTFASSVDDKQMELFKEQTKGGEWFLRGIFNKNGKAKFWLYHNSGIVIHDVPWSIYTPMNDSRRKEWQKIIRKNVTKHVYTYPSGGHPWVPGAPGVGGYGGDYGRDVPYRSAMGPNWRGNSDRRIGADDDVIIVKETNGAGGQSETLQHIQRGHVRREIGGCDRSGSSRVQIGVGTSKARSDEPEGMGL